MTWTGHPSFFSVAGMFWEDMREAGRPGRIITSRPARATTGTVADMQQAQRVECSSCHVWQ